VSPRAWTAVEEMGYAGYDALKPWRTGCQERSLPYTHNWHALSALRVSLDILFEEGLERCYSRHAEVAATCRKDMRALGLRLYPAREAFSSPTVTAAYVPENWTWERFDKALRADGMVVGGSYGPLTGRVFRIGHMGSQADRSLLREGMGVLARVLGR
jgi:aspartate aminotransferase-like enzyme